MGLAVFHGHYINGVFHGFLSTSSYWKPIQLSDLESVDPEHKSLSVDSVSRLRELKIHASPVLSCTRPMAVRLQERSQAPETEKLV